MSIFNFLYWGVRYTPRPNERPFLDRQEVREEDDLVIRVSVLDDRESERFFGVPLAHRGIQPVWVQVSNRGQSSYRLSLASIDRNYFPPLEAAYLNHFRLGRRLFAFGLLAWLFLPLLLLLPFKVFGGRSSNRRMNAFFVEHGIGWGLIRPGTEVAGFVFTNLDEGTKQVSVRLIGAAGTKDFSFSLPVPGLKVDYHGKALGDVTNVGEAIECDEGELRQRLEAMPRSTSNRRGSTEGDPLNLAVVGNFDSVRYGFGARWDETETITFRSCLRMVSAFVRGSRYRYSPVSPLFYSGRSQDFALQQARQTINQRLHLRLWLTPLRFQGKPVWIGQVSRDIGVRFTLRTWNLTTHKIDPDVDDARDYVLDDLLRHGRVAQLGYVTGVGAALQAKPRFNLTGDSYFTDGLRAIVVFADGKTNPTILNWA